MRCLRCGENIYEITYLESLGYCHKCNEFWLQKAVSKERALLSFPAEWIEGIINPNKGILNKKKEGRK